MKKNVKNLGFLIALMMVVLLVATMFRGVPEVEESVYSDLINEIEEGKVAELVLKDSTVEVTYSKVKNAQLPGSYLLGNKSILMLVTTGALKTDALFEQSEGVENSEAYLSLVKEIEEGNITEIALMGNKVAYTNKAKETRFADLTANDLLGNEKVMEMFNAGKIKISTATPDATGGADAYVSLVNSVKKGDVTELVLMDNTVMVTTKEKVTKFLEIPAAAVLGNENALTRYKNGALKISTNFAEKADEKDTVYTNLVKEIKAGHVEKLTFKAGGVDVTYKEADTKVIEAPGKYFLENETVIGQMKAGKLVVSTPAPETVSWWVSMIPSVLMFVVIIAFWFFAFRQSQGGGKGMGGFGKSKAKSPDENGKRVTFNDVAGVEEEKKELSEIVDFLRDPKKFTSLGARIPKGVLLVGPPGTGKTLLAKAVAGEAGVPFFSMSGSDFVEMFVGVGASRVRDLFEQARKSLPAIIFIDEIDAVGRQRGAGLGGGHDEREQTLNQLLVEMDGFGTNSGIIIIAATNRPDILDPALLRPGRFDRQVTVGYPDQKGREAILKIHAQNKPLDETVDLEKIAKSTYGFTGADLENILNEAAIMAARFKKDKIGQDEVDEAILKVVMGPEKKNKVNKEKDKKQTAYHEAGHAILSHILPTQDSVHQVSIIPRGQAGGFTLSLPDTDKSYISKQEMIEDIIVFMGGRLAEKIIFDEINTGASSDIDRATTLARKMVMQYGMSDKLGSMTFTSGDHEVFLGRDFSQGNNYSQETAAVIDAEIKGIIDYCYNKCEELLKENIDKLHLVAKALIEHEKLDSDEFIQAFEGNMAHEDAEDNKEGENE